MRCRRVPDNTGQKPLRHFGARLTEREKSPMQNFILHTPTKILFGKDQIAEVAGQILADARILITYGGGSVKKNGVLDQVYSALAGRDVREFSGIEPNPTYETLMKAVEVVKAENIDFLLAVGGGSVVDGTSSSPPPPVTPPTATPAYPADRRQPHHRRGADGLCADAAGHRFRIQQRRGDHP